MFFTITPHVTKSEAKFCFIFVLFCFIFVLFCFILVIENIRVFYSLKVLMFQIF